MEYPFLFNQIEFLMIDVGGQRGEHKKWLSCFNDVEAVIYLADLPDYEMFLEDKVTNKMEESLRLFAKISGNLRESTMIVLLNNMDIFQECTKERPLSLYFNDYEEFVKKMNFLRSTEEISCAYVKERYSGVFNGSRLYFIITSALDTNIGEKVFKDVRDSVLSKIIKLKKI